VLGAGEAERFLVDELIVGRADVAAIASCLEGLMVAR
jgi:hypothetical protein